MSAEVLRRAATLMRDNADSAVLATGDEPWWFEGIGWNDVHGTTYTVHSKAGAHVADAGTEEQAEHIASWHPAVALAVADWLNACASVMEAKPDAQKVLAIKVARAYLGEQP